MRNYLVLMAFAVALSAASSVVFAETNVVTEPFEGVHVIHSKSDSPRLVDMWVAEIDLKAPGVKVMVTPSNGDVVGDATPESTREFVTRVGAQLGVNGSFFTFAAKGADGKAQYNVLGLSASNGDVYSPFADGFADAINVSSDNVATVVRGTGKPSKEELHKLRVYEREVKAARAQAEKEEPKTPADKALSKKERANAAAAKVKRPEINIGVEHEPAVALYNGLGGKNRLVENGKNVADKKDLSIHPRTGVGIQRDGKLLLFTVDGREKGRSLGMTFTEMADAMIRFGARDAISLDGGGSTSFVMDDPATAANDPKVMNLPCDPLEKDVEGKEHGKERPTGNNLAVFARPREMMKTMDRITGSAGSTGLSRDAHCRSCGRQSRHPFIRSMLRIL